MQGVHNRRLDDLSAACARHDTWFTAAPLLVEYSGTCSPVNPIAML